MCDRKRGSNTTLTEHSESTAPMGTYPGNQDREIARELQSQSGYGDEPRGEPPKYDWTSQNVLAALGLHRRHQGDAPAAKGAGSTGSLHEESLNAFAALEAAVKNSRREFVAKLSNYHNELAFAGDPATDDHQLDSFLDTAMFISHRIAGTAKTLGFPELGDTARESEVATAAYKGAPGSVELRKVCLSQIRDLASLIDMICAEHGAEKQLA